MFVYKKLWDLMNAKGITRNDLRNNGILSPGTIAKLGKNERVSIDVIESLCDYLECQPGDIMEYISDKKLAEIEEKMQTLSDMLKNLMDKSNISAEELQSMNPEIIQAIQNGSVAKLFNDSLHTDPNE